MTGCEIHIQSPFFLDYYSHDTVHCKLDNLGHHSAVRPGNGTGLSSVRPIIVSSQPHDSVPDPKLQAPIQLA